MTLEQIVPPLIGAMGVVGAAIVSAHMLRDKARFQKMSEILHKIGKRLRRLEKETKDRP